MLSRVTTAEHRSTTITLTFRYFLVIIIIR
jgi:hypothetical protein